MWIFEFLGSSGGSDCELAIVLSPVPRRKISEVKDTSEAENPREARCHEVRPIPAAAIRAAHLQPTSASAPSSPRLGLRRPQQQITITTSATLKLNKQQDNSPRDRSKSPAVNRWAFKKLKIKVCLEWWRWRTLLTLP